MKNFILFISFLGHLIIILISSLILCLYIEPLLKLIGLSSYTFKDTLILWLSLGMLFVAIEIFYRALLQLIFSAPFNQTNIVDSLSFLPFTLFLIGEIFITKQNLHLPPILKNLLIIFIVFSLHSLMKLLSLFSATFGKPSSRLLVLVWVVPFLITLYLSTVATIGIRNTNFTNRIFLVNRDKLTSDGKTMIVKIPEGGFFLSQKDKEDCKEIAFNLKLEGKFNDNSDRYIYIFTPDKARKDVLKLRLSTLQAISQWVEIPVPCDLLPLDDNFIITWSSYSLPSWMVRNALIPTISVKSYAELKSLVFDENVYNLPPIKSLLLNGPYGILQCALNNAER